MSRAVRTSLIALLTLAFGHVVEAAPKKSTTPAPAPEAAVTDPSADLAFGAF